MFNWYSVGAMLMRAKTILMRGHRADEICNFARARKGNFLEISSFGNTVPPDIPCIFCFPRNARYFEGLLYIDIPKNL